MEKENNYTEIEITKSMISAILCIAFVLLANYIWNDTPTVSRNDGRADYIQIISIATLFLSVILIPITFLFSVIKSIKEFYKANRLPLVFILLLYACFSSVFFTFFV